MASPSVYLGSPALTTDASRNVIERSEREPFGQLRNRPTHDGPGFTGHAEDAQTGLTYMQQRYYDPAIGAFLSVDPVTAQGSGDTRFFNRYAYAFDNPYKFTDPDGRFPFLVPIVFGIGAYLTSNYANAPAPGERTQNLPVHEQVGAAIPPSRAIAVADVVSSIARPSNQPARKETGSYTNTHESGKTYDGKGDRKRSQESGRRVEQQTGDAHVATDWTPANSSRDAFVQESKRLDSHGGPSSAGNYNKIESPGKRLREEGPTP